MLLNDTLLAMSISWGVLAVGLQSWSDLRASQQSLQALEQMHTQQREVQRLLDRINLSPGPPGVTPTPAAGATMTLRPRPPATDRKGSSTGARAATVPPKGGGGR